MVNCCFPSFLASGYKRVSTADQKANPAIDQKADSAKDKPQEEISYFAEFSQNLGLQTPALNTGKLCKMKNDLNEALQRNFAREKISKLIKTLDEGGAENFPELEKNNFFQNFGRMSTWNMEQEPQSNPQVSPDAGTSPTSEPVSETTNTLSKLNKINTIFQNYSKNIISNQPKKGIKKETIKLFKDIRQLVPPEKKKECDELLNKIVNWGSEFINKIGMDSKQQDHLNYFEACEEFIELIFGKIEIKDENEKAKTKAIHIKEITLMCFSCAGLFLTYVQRSKTSKFFIWLKRAFVPIGYIIHELSGVALQYFVNPFFVGAMTLAASITITFILTLVVGYFVVKAIESIVDSGLEVATENTKNKLIKELNKIKDELSLEKEGLEETISRSLIRLVQKITNSFLTFIVDIIKSPYNLIKFIENKYFPSESQKIIENTKKVEPYFNGKEKPAWYEHVVNQKPLLKRKQDNNEIKQYFTLLKAYDVNDKTLNELFSLQHKFVNASDNLSEEEKQNKLKPIYESMAATVISKTADMPELNSEDYKNLSLYLTSRIENYSKFLVENSRNISHKLAHNSSTAAFFIFDGIADSSGMGIAMACELLTVSDSVRDILASVLASVGGLPLVGLGILATLSLQAWASTKDESGIKIPNESIQKEVLKYLENKSKETETALKDLKQNNTSFSTAKQARLNLMMEEIKSTRTYIEKAIKQQEKEERKKNNSIFSLSNILGPEVSFTL